MTDLTVVSLFDGIGGFPLAFERAGAKTVATVEIDDDAAEVSARHFPAATQFCDVTGVSGDDLRAVGFVPDRGIITAGWPCQDLSVAGRRAGLAGARSGLWWEVVRLLSETRSRWFVGENVPGLLSSNGGADMGAVVGALGELGYGFAYRVLDAQWFGVPQRRRRVFFVGHLGEPFTAPAEVLFECESGAGDSAAGSEAGPGAAGAVAGGARTLGDGGGLVPALVSRYAKGTDSDATDALILEPPVECATGRVTHTLNACSTGRAQEDGTGRGVPIVPYAEHNTHTHRSRRCKAGDAGATGSTPNQQPGDTSSWAVNALTSNGVGTCGADDNQAQAGHLIAMRESGQGYWMQDDVAGTLRAEGENRPSRPSVVIAQTIGGGQVTHTLSSEGSDASEDGTGRGTPIVAQPIRGGASISQDDTPLGVAENQQGEVREGHTVGALSSGGGRPGQGYQAVREGTIVRRLTPLECERLQGYPDGWTDNGQADSARYRQLGNSVAVPCVEWIARRLINIDNQQQRNGEMNA